jgi:hypothetical protein
MEFLQIIECHTSKYDELIALEEEWRTATEGKRTLRRSFIARDRNEANRYFVLAFFDDYDSAMVNSNLPETQTFGERQFALLDAPPTFTDLDVIDERG